MKRCIYKYYVASLAFFACCLILISQSCRILSITQKEPVAPTHTRVSEVLLKPNADKGKDAIIQSQDPSSNFSELENLNLSTSIEDGDSIAQRMLIAFDLDTFPDYAYVRKATLVFFRDSTDRNPNSLHFGNNAFTTYRVSESWNEQTVNWDNQPTIEVGGSVWNRESWSEDQPYFEINVTHMVRDMVNKTIDNHGFLIKLSDELAIQNLSWVSSDHRDTSLHPELRIEFRGAVHRKVNTISSIEVNDEIIYVEVWDHNKIDDDTISLFLNDEKVLENFRISGKKTKFPITLKPGFNRLRLHAENLGSIPPNTAALRIIEPGKSHPFQLKSDLDASEAVNIIYKTKKYRPDLE